MPVAPLVGAAIVSGGAGIIGGLLSSRASNRAVDAKTKADEEALAFSREQEAERKREFDEQQRQKEYAFQIEQERAQRRRDAIAPLLKRYGIDIYGKAGRLPSTGGGNLASIAGFSGVGKSSIPSITPETSSVPRGLNLGDLSKWNEWNRYGA